MVGYTSAYLEAKQRERKRRARFYACSVLFALALISICVVVFNAKVAIGK